ncbi:hypothetical protein O3M35_012245 [Rhynocoris fuscipes]|uniref:Uncharacterized protein n=1 Tax=Rhynocoris fuscipes TaxID=488301 RepID=A0AAW1CRQ1_9HEMI
MDVVKEALSKDSLEIMDGVKLIKTKEVSVKENGRSLEENIEELLETHDVELDIAGTKVTVSPKETGEITLTLNSEDKLDEARKRKSKLRKLLVPLMVFVLLKAMTLIPLALGVLGLKAWNALQLSFFSFVASLAMAIFNLFKKIASDAPPLPVAHIAEPYHYAAARNLLLPNSEDGQQMAYSAYQQ